MHYNHFHYYSIIIIPQMSTAITYPIPNLSPVVSTTESITPVFTASMTEESTIPYEEAPRRTNIIVITFATILLIIALFLLSIGGCLLFKIKRRPHKILGPNNNIVREKDDDTEVTIVSSDICEIDYAKISDEECEHDQQGMNEGDHGHREQDDKLSLNAVQMPERHTLMQPNQLRHSTCANSSECSSLNRSGQLNEGRGSICAQKDDNEAGTSDTVEMHQLAIGVNDLEESYEPAYSNIEGHFIALNQAL